MTTATQTRPSHASAVSQVTPRFIGWTIFSAGILYYCFAYLLRVFPNMMEPQLEAHFGITAADFGNLSAFYYYAYTPLQLLVGFLVDSIGPRKSLLGACMINIAGIFIFTHAEHLAAAEFGRFLIGFGSAFAYVTVLKLAIIWLPRRYFATATGLATACGMLAAAFTDTYLIRLVEDFGYHSFLNGCLIAGFVLLGIIFSVVRNKPPQQTVEQEEHASESFAPTLKDLKHYLLLLARNRQMWLIGIIGALMYLPASVFLDLWAVPYLKVAGHLTTHEAGIGVSITLLGWIIASPITGALSDKFKTRKRPLLYATAAATLIAVILFYVPNLSKEVIYGLLFALGVCCAPHPLCFTMSKENNPQHISGTAIAFANCLIMLGGALFQPIVGKLLDFVWAGSVMDQVRIYSATDFKIALSIIPIGLICALLLSFFLKETFQKELHQSF